MSTLLPIPLYFGNIDNTINIISAAEYPTLYLYYMSQDSEPGFNNIRSCVVCASSQKEAMKINPLGDNDPDWEIWPGAEDVKVIGKAWPGIKDGEVICSTFNHLLLN